jgi:hypothetical protein
MIIDNIRPVQSWKSIRIRLSTLLALFLVLFLNSTKGLADSSEVLSYKLQTAFIYQFTKWVEWPAMDKNPDLPFVITVIGNSSASSSLIIQLNELAQLKKILDKKIKILSVEAGGPIVKSPIIIVIGKDASLLRRVLVATRGTSTLVISDSSGFGALGAMINFYKEEDKLRFEINRKALEKEKLVVGSQLLKLARIVE